MTANRRESDDVARLLRSLIDRVDRLERGMSGAIAIPAGHSTGGAQAYGVIDTPFVATGPSTDQLVWSAPVIAAGSAPAITVRIDSESSWSITAGLQRVFTTETAVTPVTQSGSGGWNGTLTLSNGGGTPVTTGLLFLTITLASGHSARIVTRSTQ